MAAIGEAARRSGVPIETIRYYERQGLVPKPARAANGRRVYTPEDIGRLRFVRQCRDLGFPLSDVRALLALSAGDNADCAEVMTLGIRHLETIRDKISELKRLEAALEELTANCAKGKPDCPMLEKLRGR